MVMFVCGVPDVSAKMTSSLPICKRKVQEVQVQGGVSTDMFPGVLAILGLLYGMSLKVSLVSPLPSNQNLNSFSTCLKFWNKSLQL